MNRMPLLAMLLFASVASAEPLNYDYVYMSSNDVERDDGTESSGETFGGFLEFAETLHAFASLDNGNTYAGTGDNPAWRYDTRTLRAGIGAHYLLGTRMMLAPSVAILRSEREINAPGWATPREFSDTGYSMQLDFRYAVSNWFELTAGARSSRLFDATDTRYVGGLLFHPTDWLALGALHHEGDAYSSTELTARWYY